MPSGGQSCQNVNEYCTIQETIYGYYPSLGANVFFCAFFGLCMIIQLVQGTRFRSWSFMVAMGVGCLGEAVGMSICSPRCFHDPLINLEATSAE